MHQRFIVGTLIVLVIIAAGYFGHRYWKSHHKSNFKVLGYEIPIAIETDARAATSLKKRGRRMKKGRHEGFGGDDDSWPQAGTFGNMSDTNPYGNYADGRNMFYPSYNERAPYWTRS